MSLVVRCQPYSALGQNGSSLYTGGRPSSAHAYPQRLAADEQLGFDAAVTAIGLKASVSEAQHPLICEGIRRQKGELAIAMLLQYKDDQYKLDKVHLLNGIC